MTNSKSNLRSKLCRPSLKSRQTLMISFLIAYLDVDCDLILVASARRTQLAETYL